MAEYQDALYKRGFLLTDKEVEAPKTDWAKQSFVNGEKTFYLYYDTANKLSYQTAGKYWCIALGLIMDTISWNMDQDTICLHCVKYLKNSRNAFYEYTDNLNGRFVLIFGDGKKITVLSDATGMRSIFYHEKICMVASHYQILADLSKAEPNPYFEKFNKLPAPRPWILPGDMSPYNDIRILIPNHEFDLVNLKIKRFYPRSNHPTYAMEDIVDNIADNLKKQMEVLAKEFTPLIAITGGNDSKVTMSASREVRNKAVYFTYSSSATNETSHRDAKQRKRDNEYSQYICSLYNLNFVNLDLNHPINEDILKIAKQNHYHQHIITAIEPYMYNLPEGINIRSNLIEIVRDLEFLWQYNDKLSNAENMLKWMMYGPHKTDELMGFTEDFLKRNAFDKIYDYELLHLFYWEYRMGTWVNASVLLEDDFAFNTYMLFNCRKLLEYGFCIPKYYRDKNYITKNVVKKLWPELLFRLENSPDTLMEYFDMENGSELKIKETFTPVFGNDKDQARKPKMVYLSRAYGAIFGFGECSNFEADWCGIRSNIKTKKDSTYHMQINLLSSRNNKLKSGDVDLLIFFNNKEIYRIDLSYLVNRLNQINVFFKAESDSQRVALKLFVKHDINNSLSGCNGVLDLKSIILKEDCIPYDDKVYVVSTTNICTKRFFNAYFNLNK